MKIYQTLLLLFLARSGTAFGTLTLSPFEKQVLAATNQVRENPRSLIPDLEKLLKKFDGKHLYVSPSSRIATEEGVAPVHEAIRVLRSTKAVPKLILNDELTKAARDHRAAQGPTGAIGHYGADGKSPEQRLKNYGTPVGKSGENITYGNYGGFEGRDVVIATIVDDGVADRGHRRNFFDPAFKVVGIACGNHTKYERMCVFDFATAVRRH